jgi:hypothetical protein
MLFIIFPFLLFFVFGGLINPLTPNGHYSGCTAPLTSILNIYSINIRTEYFEHAA